MISSACTILVSRNDTTIFWNFLITKYQIKGYLNDDLWMHMHPYALASSTTLSSRDPDSKVNRPTWGKPGADRTHVGPMLAPWTLLSGDTILARWCGQIINFIRNSYPVTINTHDLKQMTWAHCCFYEKLISPVSVTRMLWNALCKVIAIFLYSAKSWSHSLS